MRFHRLPRATRRNAPLLPQGSVDRSAQRVLSACSRLKAWTAWSSTCRLAAAMARILESVTVALLLASAGTTHAQCELAKIFATDGAFADFFGTALSVSDTTLVVG